MMIIKFFFSIFWFIVTAFSVYLVYVVFQTESDPQTRWGWIVLAFIVFLSISLLTYNVVSIPDPKNDRD